MTTAWANTTNSSFNFSACPHCILFTYSITGINKKGKMNIQIRAVSPFLGAPVRRSKNNAIKPAITSKYGCTGVEGDEFSIISTKLD